MREEDTCNGRDSTAVREEDTCNGRDSTAVREEDTHPPGMAGTLRQ